MTCYFCTYLGGISVSLPGVHLGLDAQTHAQFVVRFPPILIKPHVFLLLNMSPGTLWYALGVYWL